MSWDAACEHFNKPIIAKTDGDLNTLWNVSTVPILLTGGPNIRRRRI
jgi:hypothetical protein